VVFAIAGAVFGHYYIGTRRDEADIAPGAARPLWIGRIAAVAVALTAVLGLWMSGSPGMARADALDQRRAQDLQTIRQAVLHHQATFGALPDSLGALRDYGPGAHVPALRDPVSETPYEYRRLDERRYELCATFERATDTETARTRSPYGDFWRHPAGRACFTLTVPQRTVP
jgi:hypothetical protein